MGETSWSFQTRYENSGDDGRDFERFVLECFRTAKQEALFSKSLRRGRDGAIDLIDQHSLPGTTTIAECKYIGSGGFGEAKARWREVYKHLVDHLPRLSANPGERNNSSYRTWLDSDRPIRRYRFCITISLTGAEVIRLEKLIAQDFAKLADVGVEAVRHLAEIQGAIRVLSWDWFHTELTDCPSLAFRWFRGLPIGVNAFERGGRTGQSFRDFLSGGQLVYFSRDSFAAKGSDVAARGEAELVEGLVSGEIRALVLAGPGGVGKTRLAHELAIKLTDETMGFDAYWLERGASAMSVQEVVGRYPAKASILFLIDYAEAAQRLTEIADMVAQMNHQAGHQIRIVATCRASATNRLRDALEILNPEMVSLASRVGGEHEYLDWVTGSILALEPFPAPDQLAQVCRGIPALAAFAVYLFRADRAQFNDQFGGLLATRDFESWSNKRIAALMQGTSFSERATAEIAIALPIPPDRLSRFRQTHGDLIDRLVADRWIEYVDGNLAAAHDILADALLARWLFETESATTARVVDLLETAASAEDLPHSFIVLARLVAHPGFVGIDGQHVAQALLAMADAKQVTASAGQILDGPLLKLQHKLDLIASLSALSQAIVHNPSLQLSVAKIAEQVGHARKHGEDLTVPAAVGDLLDLACWQGRESNYVLRRAFAFDPERFRERAFANIALFPVVEKTHFLIAEMLRSGECPDAMREAVQNWIKANSRVACASFVYKAWLDAGGERDAVHEPLLGWVDAHGLTIDAQFIYDAWLKAGGERKALHKPLLDWFGVHGLTLHAQFVYTAWLDAGGEREAIGQSVLDWVAAHGLTPEAQFVYTAWLYAGGELEAVREPLLGWVDVYGLTLHAQFVYTAWLDAGGEQTAIRKPLLQWAEVFGQEFSADHVYRAWLDAGGDLEDVEQGVFGWAVAWSHTEDFVYLSKPLSRRKNLPVSVVLALIQWAVTYPRNEDSVSRIRRVVGNLPSTDISIDGFTSLIDQLFRFAENLGPPSDIDRSLIWSICLSLANHSLYSLNPFAVCRFVARIIGSGLVFDRRLTASSMDYLIGSQDIICHLAVLGVREGVLDPVRDSQALNLFADWIEVSTPDAVDAARLLAKLRRELR